MGITPDIDYDTKCPQWPMPGALSKQNEPEQPAAGASFRLAGFRDAAAIVLLAVVYFAAGKFGLSLAFINASASAVWPGTALGLAGLLLFWVAAVAGHLHWSFSP